MKLLREPLPGLLEFELTIHGDDRGSFQETFNRATLAGFGVDLDVMQDNESWSASRGTIRGLHLQTGEAAQGKLIRVTRGRVLDVALDLSDETPRLFWIPAGFAHGFCTLEDDTVMTYKVDAPYDPAAERTIRFDDPELGIDWPIDRAEAVLSDKDAVAAPLSAYLAEVTA
ncbi:MAG: dTDP-4-dehydrorhamnose 3,5-epimerase [Ilumatobacter sp.]